MTEIINERIQIQSKAKKWLAVLKFNNYSRLSIDLNIIFADGFAVILK